MTKFNNEISSIIYFLSFIVIVAMFFLNLFIGVIFYNFSIAEKKFKFSMLKISKLFYFLIKFSEDDEGK